MLKICLLDIAMLQDEDGEYLDDVDIDGHIAFLLFAAFDTTTSALDKYPLLP